MSNLKRISVISVMLFIAILITTISFAKTGTVNVEEVIVREGPSTTTNVVTGIKGNTEVEILGEEQGFYKIKYNETTGYIRSDLLNVKEEVVENEQAPVEENNIETEKNETVQEENVLAESTTDNVEIKEEETKEFPKEITLTTNVNVYILPIYTSTIITTIENGNNITINREVNNWSYITSGNITGWVRNYNLNNPTDIVADEEQQEEQEEQEE
ncbi:MAG: SH3 domain-containing protein, partial [Clostridia bacterium]|nr:SH3 domain-containing protein [Clostridia bacterium]